MRVCSRHVDADLVPNGLVEASSTTGLGSRRRRSATDNSGHDLSLAVTSSALESLPDTIEIFLSLSFKRSNATLRTGGEVPE